MILNCIREVHGDRNTEAGVLFTFLGEAAIFVQDANGNLLGRLVLTTIAESVQTGGLSREELIQQYILSPDPGLS